MNWWYAPLALGGFFIARDFFYLIYYYLQARGCGFPIIVSPFNHASIPFMIFSGALRPWMKRNLPSWIYDIIKAQIYGWEYVEKSDLHDTLGPVFLIVCPGRIDVWIADPVMAWDVLTRRTDFIQYDAVNKVMGMFGPNLLSVIFSPETCEWRLTLEQLDGDDWQRHRKLVAPTINERVSAVVWDESSKQTSEMLDHFLEAKVLDGGEILSGLRLIAIHVLGRAAYGQPQRWAQEDKPLLPGQSLTYIEAVTAIIQDLVLTAVAPHWLLSLPFLPDKYRTLAKAKREYPECTAQLVKSERERAASQGETRNNIMSMLVRASDAGKSNKGDAKAEKLHLSEEDISGSLWFLTAAGFDTTANALGFAAILLAAKPDVQGWLIEEVDQVLGPLASTTPEYLKIFPRLTRCLAFMHEVLRMYPLVVHVARGTNTVRIVSNGSETLRIPKDSLVYLNSYAIQISRKTWGEDALEFRPSRWMNEDSTLIIPAKGTFLPWSGGPRVCPGQKFSQVEFVATIATIVQRCRIAPILMEGESLPTAQNRLMGVLDDAQSRLTLTIIREKDLTVKFVDRRRGEWDGLSAI